MQSALYSLLMISEGNYRKDEYVLMLSCVVIASVAPSQVILGHKENFHRFVLLIRSQLHSENTYIVSKTLQALSSIFARPDVNVPFISALGRDVFKLIRPFVTGDNVIEKVKNISDEELNVLQDAVKTLEVMTTVVDDKRKIGFVSLLIQSLCQLLCANSVDEWRLLNQPSRRAHEFAIQRLNTIALSCAVEFKQNISDEELNVLQDAVKTLEVMTTVVDDKRIDEWRLLNQPSRRAHEFAIQRLNAIALSCAVEFKQVLECRPKLKKQLVCALLFQSSRQVQVQQLAKAKIMAAESKEFNMTQQPTIKLTMDFNSYGKAAF
ncbi:hypothetical protein DICVIV_10828 [Dictyocaulus viviparus]|uniref:HEAT repeat protein n=1 Tax=Dictyocaulus viviparus TaxID=29172 RepID=A0A0D8XES2_DICVI|nr:hypothetical protein DICVIV_10828 [Dictyocaulus viviparus]